MFAPLIRQRLPIKSASSHAVAASKKATIKTPPKRTSDRLDVRLPVSLCSKNYMIREQAFIGNISTGGTFLLTDNYSLDKDERICIEVPNSVDSKLCIMGTVMWSNLFPIHATPAGEKGIGVRFQASQDPDFKKWMLTLGIK